MSDLTLIIPAKNEKESLPKVLDELKGFDFKKNVILEASDKLTIEAVKTYDCKIIYQDSIGYGDALKKGIETIETEFFCIFNADGSFNPKELDQMIKKLKNEKYDFVFASRYEKNCGSEDDTLITLVGNYIFTFLGKIFFKLKITDILYTFVMARTSCAKKLRLTAKDFSFCVELPIKAKRANYKICTSKSYERSRIGGKKKVNAFRDGLKILFSMIKLVFRY
jgi:glycosyltransferase involved in cell wall biosynthesis